MRSNLNGHWAKDKNLKNGDPRQLIKDVQSHLSTHKYFYMSCTGDQHWTNNPNDPTSLVTQCDDQVIGGWVGR